MNKKIDTEKCESFIDDLISKMTLEQKVLQLQQVSANCVGEKKFWEFVDKGAGSFLHVLGKDLPKAKKKMKNADKIPAIYGIDAIHGHALHNGATVFPSQLSMACSWNPKMVEEMGVATASEVASDGIEWMFSPVLCLGRDLRWGRVDETFGEDPYLVGELGAAIVRGYEKAGNVIACAKHYLGYGEATGGMDSYDTEVTERKIREVFLPPFKKAIDAGCSSIMTAYGSIDGTPITASHRLMTEILRDELGFDGFVVTDWCNVEHMVNDQKVFPSNYESSVACINAGNDMCMNSPDFYPSIVKAVKNGDVTEETLNDRVRNVLRVKYRLGMFENNRKQRNTIGAEKHKKLNHAIAKESLVLLENNGVLPLKKSTDKIGVYGLNATDVHNTYGDWTFYTHPDLNLNATPLSEAYTVWEGMKVVFGEGSLFYNQGYDFNGNIFELQACDTAVVVLGDNFTHNGECHDRQGIEVEKNQIEMLKRLRKLCKNIIVVMICGKPLLLDEVKENSDAIIMAFNPGGRGGLAIAEMINGDFSPSGKLPISIPHRSGQIPCYYNRLPGWHAWKYVDSPAGNAYDFGDGLSYTKFDYAEIKVSSKKLREGKSVTISGKITNNGDYDGAEIVQLYYRDVVSSVITPVKNLCGFKKIFLKKGETKNFSFKIKPEDLSLVNANCERVTEKGKFQLFVGANLKNLTVLEIEYV